VTARQAGLASFGLLLVFAVLVVLGGSVNTGYEHSVDFVSSLAGRGSEQAWIGVVAIGSYGLAHGAAAVPWRHASRVVCAGLLACAALLITVAATRASCPGGAAGCALNASTGPTDAGDTIHGVSVGIYALLFLVTAVTAGVVMARRRRWYAAAAALLSAALSIAALSQVDEITPGAEQRLWLAINGIGLLVLIALAGSGVQPSDSASPAVRR
jgi:hypothetical protein